MCAVASAPGAASVSESAFYVIYDPRREAWRRPLSSRARQPGRDARLSASYWLTDLPRTRVSSRTLYRFAKSRWENSLVIGWLLTMFALTIERLYRSRCLHRGPHAPLTAIEFVRAVRLSLCPPRRLDSS
jgi:hypothetical protein